MSKHYGGTTMSKVLHNHTSHAAVFIAAALASTCPAQMQIGANFFPMGWGGWDLERGNWGNLFTNNPNGQISGAEPVFKAEALAEVDAAYNGPLRWMEANHVNTALTNEYHRSGRWEDRKPKSDYTQNLTLAYEYQIDFTNRVDRDYWVNVPCTADDDYVTQLATLIKGSLSPSRKIYVEWANETWNSAYPAFQSYRYCDSVATRLAIPAPSAILRVARYTTIRSLEVFALFEQVFSDQPNRLVKVLPGWMTQVKYTQMVFDTYNDPQYNPNNVVADAFTVTGYCGVSGNTSGATPGIHETVRGYFDSWGRPLWSAHKALCDANGVDFVAYEAGSLCSNNPQAFTTHPDMYGLITDLYNTLADYFTVVLPFCHAGTWEFAKPWVGCPEQDAHVYRAIKDWTTGNPVAVSQPVVAAVRSKPKAKCYTVVANGASTLSVGSPAADGTGWSVFSLGGRAQSLTASPVGALPAGYYLLEQH